MNSFCRFTGFVVCVVSFAFGVDTLTPLRWARSLSEVTVSPKNFYDSPTYIVDWSESAFLCFDGNKMVIIGTAFGEVQKTAPGTKTGTVCKNSENGYVLTADDTITLMDSTLEKVWSKRVMDGVFVVDAVETADSGFAILGRIEDTTIMMIKTDKNLDTVWTRVIPYPDQHEFATPPGNYYSRIAQSAGGYVVCGTYLPYGQLGANGCVAKFSDSGVREWTKIAPGLTLYDMTGVENGVVMTGMMDLQLASERQTQDPGLGKELYFPVTGIAFVRMGPDGEILINKDLGGMETPSGGLNTANIGRMIGMFEDTFVIASYMYGELIGSNEPITKVSIIAVDSEGTRLWSKEYSGIGGSFVNAQFLSSGDLVILANDSLFYYSDIIIGVNNGKKCIKAVSQPPFFSVSRNRVSFTLQKESATDIILYTYKGELVRSVGMGRLALGRHEVSFTDVVKGSYIVRCIINGDKTVQESVVLY